MSEKQNRNLRYFIKSITPPESGLDLKTECDRLRKTIKRMKNARQAPKSGKKTKIYYGSRIKRKAEASARNPPARAGS